VSAQLSLSGMDLPRRNGELAFDAPWQSTVLALTAAVVEHAFGGGREPFRRQLIKAIAADPGRSTGRSIVTVRLGWPCDNIGARGAEPILGAVLWVRPDAA
jgi:hypothetical protein